MREKIKVAVLYRVIQEWRRPVFDRLHAHEDLRLKLFYGPDFENSKVVSSKKPLKLPTKRMWSFKLRKVSKNGLVAMPISPFLLWHLLLYRPEVIVTEGASNLFNALTGFIYCKIMRKRYIWWSLGRLKGTIHTGFRKYLDHLIQYLERNSDAIISYSSLGARYYQEIGVPSEKVFVAVNVVDTESKLQMQSEVADHSFVKRIRKGANLLVLFVGALTPQKRLDVLIDAFVRIKEHAPGTRLVVVGDGEERKNIEAMIQRQNLDNVDMVGKVFDGVHEYFMSADLFVLPGLGGLAVSEAMLYGVPVIASVGDGCEKDLIDHGVNGIIDEKMDANSLAKHLLQFYNNPYKLKAFQGEARATIENKYNLNKYLDQVVLAIKSTRCTKN